MYGGRLDPLAVAPLATVWPCPPSALPVNVGAGCVCELNANTAPSPRLACAPASAVASIAATVPAGVPAVSADVASVPAACVWVLAPPVSSAVSKSVSPESSPTMNFPPPHAAHVPYPSSVAGFVETVAMKIDPTANASPASAQLTAVAA